MEPSSSPAPKSSVIMLRPPKSSVIVLKDPREFVTVLKVPESSNPAVMEAPRNPNLEAPRNMKGNAPGNENTNAPGYLDMEAQRNSSSIQVPKKKAPESSVSVPRPPKRIAVDAPK